jgi:cation transport ATPase
VSEQPPPEEPPGRDIVPPESVPPVSAEDLVDGQVAEEERRYPSTLGGAFYLVLLAAVAVGLLVVVYGDWRLGIWIMGGSLLASAIVRVALPSRDAGMLAVRNKPLDAVVLVAIGVAMIWLAGSIPDQPGP